MLYGMFDNKVYMFNVIARKYLWDKLTVLLEYFNNIDGKSASYVEYHFKYVIIKIFYLLLNDADFAFFIL